MELDHLKPHDFRRLGLLGRVIELTDAKEQASSRTLTESEDASVERQTVTADASALEEEGLLNLDRRFGGAWLARPTQAGRDAWAELSQSRNDRAKRTRQLRNDYLGWIHSTRSSGSAVSDDFLLSGPSYLGVPYLEDEFLEAGAWLRDRNFIAGEGAWGRKSPLFPSLTAKGEDYVENDRDVHSEATEGDGGTSYAFHGPTQFATGSRHFTQTQNIGDVKNGVEEIARALYQLSQLSTGQQEAELTAAAVQLEEEVAGQARPHRLRTIAEGVQRILVGGAGGALGAFTSKQVAEFLESLPLS
ncbi:hypothetical protein ASF48_07725 [Rathayibacter sp. Leaf299]|uniref:hypothetical protein n=1 Tax=Rathayibacter sp. Leaf299 TaxID=1736328 RepID=UPI0006F615F5|nr:hypothetical protein [Rathayibacter sp. Leaf299]KQQ20519.1 hypothetical protein ASF48_07725 [Rathayibacter sp. Leaf299]